MARIDAMTLLDFQQRFNNEQACEEYLFTQKWPGGFKCPDCQHKKYYFVQTRRIYECRKCGHQTSLTAGTLLHRSKLPLLKWFWAIYMVVHDKRGRSALSIAGLLKINYRTAWRLLHKIRHSMCTRDANYVLSGLVEMDDAYFGAPQKGSDGRGTTKAKVIIALSTDESGNPKFIRMKVASRISKEEIQRVALSCVKPGSTVTSDGLNCYQVLKDIGYDHHYKDYYKENEEFLKWLHIVISNAKAFILGTYHGLSKKYLQPYLDEYCYRF